MRDDRFEKLLRVCPLPGGCFIFEGGIDWVRGTYVYFDNSISPSETIYTRKVYERSLREE